MPIQHNFWFNYTAQASEVQRGVHSLSLSVRTVSFASSQGMTEPAHSQCLGNPRNLAFHAVFELLGGAGPDPLMRRFGFSSVTIMFGPTLPVNQTLEPITVFSPTTVSPPRIVALA